ncbi:MAG: hypothetical protein KBT03_01380 [Bacteroidales bacterium]|nr:hypothetical protein [Candidatus Scybalousia scybalohippi]
MASQQLIDYFQQLKNLIEKNGLTAEYVDILKKAAMVAISEDKDIQFGLEITEYAKRSCESMVEKQGYTIWDLEKYCFANHTQYELIDKWYEILLIEAQNMVLDSYLLYLEKNRLPKDRFYAPKRKQFLKIELIQSLQDMIDDKLDVLSISLPPGTGKSTMEKFFHSAVCGWFPDEYSLFFSHSAGITRMYYDGILDIMTNSDDYTWGEIFPDCKITNTNAKMEQININRYKPFPNVQTASVGSEMAGKVRASKFLFVDDMIGKIEEALNKNILEKLWGIYSTDALQRKTVDSNDKPCKEIHIATRWSVKDIIGRLKEQLKDDPRARFIAVPDIDPETGLSNFNYDFKGMDEEFFHKQERFMDEISYRCLYKNDPIEREGLLYHENELRRYSSLPIREPDAILGICDVKNKGTDFMFLPCMYQYDDDYYLVDCVCDDNSDYGIQYEKLTNIILNHNMQQCEFESNAGGDRVSFEVNKRVEENGGRCNITDKPTETNKETRIIVNADWVKKHVLFRDKETYTSKDDYGIMMSWLLSYSIVGKNTHDDVPDGLANFCLYVTKGNRIGKCEPVRNFMWYGGRR